jgi:light-regulated signal transduction histidine kinase (bacteriophytochrome)
MEFNMLRLLISVSGLLLCSAALGQRLVELHGGQIAVDSAVGGDSTFRVTLPVGR